MNRLALIAGLTLLLAACSQGEPTVTTSPAGSETDRPTMETKAYNPWQDPMRAMDKAKGVEGVLQQGARQRDEQLRRMEQ